MSNDQQYLLDRVAEIVAAYVENNRVEASQLPALIGEVHASLSGLGQESKPAEVLEPAVNPKRSVKPDHIVCLEDGKRFKSLKRHLGTSHGLTPYEYRHKWSLPQDYPMVAPNYSEARSHLAVALGLGRKATVESKRATKQAKRR